MSDADEADLSTDAVTEYRSLRAKVRPDAEELSWSDTDLLHSIGALTRSKHGLVPTVAGLLLFGSSPALRRCMPMMRIDYIRVPGRAWVSDPDSRFDTLEIRAPLFIAVRRAVNAVSDDLLRSFVLPEGSIQSVQSLELPTRVLREAIVNAVMHRSYQIHGPIQIIRYSNRLEIRNPGYSLKAHDALGEPGSETRNPKIAAALHELNIAETKGSGIRVMRELMRQENLMPPTFESKRDPSQFTATLLLHHLLSEFDIEWAKNMTSELLDETEITALVFLREVGAIDNATYRSLSGDDTLVASSHLRRLRDLELLEKKGGGNQVYYVPGPNFRNVDSEQGLGIGSDPGEAESSSQSDPHQVNADPHQLGSDPHQVRQDSALKGDDSGALSSQDENEVSKLHASVPSQLLHRVRSAGKRPRRSVVRELVLELCGWRSLSASELASLLSDRDRKTLVREHLTPLVNEGRLHYSIPDMVKHPDQKYQTGDVDATE